MTHLYIEQATDRTEEVNSSIISKLYELAISGDLDNTSDLKGRLHTTICKDTHYNYLNSNFNELYISADTLSITFEDPDVERAVVSYLGTDGNVLQSDIKAFITSGKNFGEAWRDPRTLRVRSWTTIWSTRQTWNSFNEFRLFEGVTTIHPNAFEDCRQLTSIQLPTTIKTITNQAFHNCVSLSSINLDNVEILWAGVFYGCPLGVVNLPNIVDFVTNSNTNYSGDAQTFEQSGVTEVNLGPNLQHFEVNGVFYKCTSLTKVTGLSNITDIPINTFKDCSSLSNVDIDWSKITTVKRSSFEGCTTMPFGELSIPNLVTINSGAFKSCLGLTKLTGLNNITSVPENIFQGCSNLTTVDIDWSKITSIDAGAFQGCSNILLSNISIPNLTSIGSGAFWNSGIQSINNLGSITTIPSDAFNNCSQLTSLKIPSTVTSIYHNAFIKCKNLQETYDLSNVTFIEYNSFSECNKVVISNFPRIATYPSNCFYGIGNSSITIPKEVTTLENGVFWNCKNLTQVTFESPCNITTLSIDLFNACTSLQSIVIPEGITTVNRDCFSGCTSLQSIEFPSTVTTFNGRVAFNSPLLQSITIKATTPPQIDSDTLPGRNYTIYVPTSSVSAYQSATGWSSVASRIQAIPT